MATVKVKLRPSSVKGKAGTIYYRIIHTRRTQHITTTLYVFPEEWDAENGRYCLSPPKDQPAILYQMGTTHADIGKYDLADNPYLLPIIRDMERDK